MRPSLICALTTVQPPTPCVQTLGGALQEHGGKLLVIGDKKGPTTFDLPNSDFYSLERQLALPYELARLLPVGHYARKNLAYLLAMAGGAERIYETDDDNQPQPWWEPREQSTVARPVPSQRWINVYRLFTRELIWPRGLPLDRIAQPPQFDARTPPSQVIAPIQQGLADGAPDVDAIWRLVMDQEVIFEHHPSVWLPPGTWCPFNSQNTWWWRDAFPLMYLPSYCTFRMTDIWRSFIAQRCLWEVGYGVVFHAADVVQQRNVHNLMRDFKDEIPGYENNGPIADLLAGLSLRSGPANVADNLIRCYEAMIAARFLPAEEMRLLRAWINHLIELPRPEQTRAPSDLWPQRQSHHEIPRHQGYRQGEK